MSNPRIGRVYQSKKTDKVYEVVWTTSTHVHLKNTNDKAEKIDTDYFRENMVLLDLKKKSKDSTTTWSFQAPLLDMIDWALIASELSLKDPVAMVQFNERCYFVTLDLFASKTNYCKDGKALRVALESTIDFINWTAGASVGLLVSGYNPSDYLKICKKIRDAAYKKNVKTPGPVTVILPQV